MIYDFSRYEIGDQGIQEIRKGVLDALRRASEGHDFVDKIMMWRETLASYTPSLVGLDAIDIDFVKSVLVVFKAHHVPS